MEEIRGNETGMSVEAIDGNMVFKPIGHLNFTPEEYGTIKESSKGHQYVVMYRDHADGNGKGEYFAVGDFDRIFSEQGYWFNGEDRPIHTIVLTNDDVPSIVAKREHLIRMIQMSESKMNEIVVPPKPKCDGRATRNTNPNAFEEWDNMKLLQETRKRAMKNRIDVLRAELEKTKNYSTTLYRIK